MRRADRRHCLFAGLLAACGVAPAQQVCGNDAIAVSAPTDRFQDEGDGTVTDKDNMLMWTRCSAGQTRSAAGCSGAPAPLDWASAQGQAQALNAGGALFFNDWRLPSVRELATLVERRCENPRVNLAVFPGTVADTYWTSSSRPGVGAAAGTLVLDFGARGVVFADRSEPHRLRLVRSAR
ncbi:MAG: DUF1566 domain-containing protein [Chitinophagaceae bacterium]|nr:DUF1566 domain-containing protein [Rubrivivax sp.]